MDSSTNLLNKYLLSTEGARQKKATSFTISIFSGNFYGIESKKLSDLAQFRHVLLDTVNSSIKACLVFDFRTFGAVLYSSFCQFLPNKCQNFHDYFLSSI